MPDAVSAQGVSADFQAIVDGIYEQSGDDSTRLAVFKSAIDTCGSNKDAEALSYAFVRKTAECGAARNLAIAYMYAGYFSNNNGDIPKALDQSFKGLEIADSLKMTATKTVLLLNISAYLGSLGDHDGSFFYIQQAQDVAEESKDYANLIDIYYNIAIAYIDQELYESAIQYFRKDIDASLKIGCTKTIEQELTIQSLIIKNALKLHDTVAALEQIDYVNSRMGEIRGINDANGISNYCISMITSNIDAIELMPKRRDEYLRNCKQYLDILRETIDSADAKILEKLAYNPYYSRYLAVCGDYDKAWHLLEDPANFLDDDGYNMAMFEYCKGKKKYKEAYDYFWLLYRDNFRRHSLETAIHYEKSESRGNYERRITELKDMAQYREEEFKIEQKITAILRHGILTALLIGLAVIIVSLYYLRMRTRLYTKLKASNEQLLTANNELNTQREEILSQTDEIQHQSSIIMAQRDTLSTTNAHLLQSISIARDIQTAAMVSSEKLCDVVGENFIYWQPLNIVSGDFYWCTKIGRQSYLAVADCTGHGVPGALLSMYCISMLNDIVWRHPQCNAAQILAKIKVSFVKSFVFDEDEQYFLDGMDIALVIINRDLMSLDYAGAKRPLIIVSGGELQELKPDKVSICHNPMRKDDDNFTDHSVTIRNGDMVYAFSDGIPDQFGYDDGTTKFGSRQLQNILTEMSFFDLPAQKKIIESSVDNWRIGAFLAGLSEIKAPQLDDQLLIGIRI